MSTLVLPTAVGAPIARPLDTAALEAAVARVSRLVAPVWPLKHFVAVNPFLGLADRTLGDAATELAQTAGARVTMTREFYADAIRSGRITDAHLAAALAAEHAADAHSLLPVDVAAFRAVVLSTAPLVPAPTVPTVSDIAERVLGEAWSRTATDRISAWASTYFDEGQAPWRSPWRDLPPYGAWKAEAELDRTPELLGAHGFCTAVATLPDTASATIAAAIAELGIPTDALDAYLHRLLRTVSGWAAYARYQVWQSELDGNADDAVAQLLAVRLGWEVALHRTLRGVAEAWRIAAPTLAAPLPRATVAQLRADCVLQAAYELGWQADFRTKLEGVATRGDLGAQRSTRPAVQAAFCIDVRSEVFRRQLEQVDDGVRTIGFAGFFGFPIEYVPVGMDQGGAQCPVLLTPKVVIGETVTEAPASATARVGAARVTARRAALAWKAFKRGAASCFAFVSPLGLTYAGKLFADALGQSRPVTHPGSDSLPAGTTRQQLGPSLEPTERHGRAMGLPVPQRVAMAETVLRAMSLTEGFGRIVVLAGHGSTTVNNPHATGLDCGACGGHTGEANARVAAAVLNDPAVREALPTRGITIPADTIFLGALHDTTTDEVTLFEDVPVPATHRAELRTLEAQLAEAGRRTRAARASLLGMAPGAGLDREVLARSRDWAQVRPEWGLAGCAAFIAAPRARTEGLDLGGRAFLHSYDWRKDDGFGVLELILTAPVVVASWISLQYYGSTVDNRAFGSGNKTLHNVVGALGVLEGNGGDLRTGLPWQSVHDGTTLVHEPLRLTVVIEAPVEAMTAVLAKHEGVRQLLDNGWLHLWALGEDGRVAARYAGGLRWERGAEAVVAG